MSPVQSVAICSVGELFGGVERHILAMLAGLRGRGIATQLVLFHDGELAEAARRQGDDPWILPSDNRRLLATSRSLARLLKEAGIVVVHAHGYKATVACALARSWHRFALVKTQHGLPEPMAGKLLQVPRDRLYHALDAVATRLAVGVVCYVTEELRAYYRPGLSGTRAEVVPNGVPWMDGSRFARPADLTNDGFNLAIVGRLDPVKGHEVAIRALARREAPSDSHLQIIGVGPSEEALKALARTLGVADRVHFLGFRRNVLDYVAHCDALLIPSLHEGLPFVLLEGMALASAIIASRVGGLAEVLRDRETGLLAPVADVAAIACAIGELREQPGYRQRLGQNAQARQRAAYSLEEMAARYVSIYESVIPERKSA